MKKYTFYVIGLGGLPFYPCRLGGQIDLVSDWTPDITEAVYWETPEGFDWLMEEYIDPVLVCVTTPEKQSKESDINYVASPLEHPNLVVAGGWSKAQVRRILAQQGKNISDYRIYALKKDLK